MKVRLELSQRRRLEAIGEARRWPTVACIWPVCVTRSEVYHKEGSLYVFDISWGKLVLVQYLSYELVL